MADRVTIAAHAKANLFLRVLAREASGFHTLETLFTLLELSDELHVERTAGGIDLAVDGADTGSTRRLGASGCASTSPSASRCGPGSGAAPATAPRPCTR
jgi:hypothetical protein